MKEKNKAKQEQQKMRCRPLRPSGAGWQREEVMDQRPGDRGVWFLDYWRVIPTSPQPHRIFAVPSTLGELSQEGGG